VFPYEYLDNDARLDESELPPIEAFTSKLRANERIAQSDYEFAHRVWHEFKCQTLRDYMLLYLKTDVLLLADVFESFRNTCLSHYQLDGAHYVSAPNLSWDAMLQETNTILDLIPDAAMFRLIDNGIRGGMAMIVKRYARANNPYLGPEHYDPKRPLSYLVYLDANNLYGYAMSQPMPFANFRFLRIEEISEIDWLAQSDDQETGYFVCADWDVPDEVHESQNDFPLMPERLHITLESLSAIQLRLRRRYNFPRSSNYVKLISTLARKEKYMAHYQMVKFALEHGLRMTHVHAVIAFSQKPWLSPYIMRNQELRAASKTEFEKEFFKLMNNSVYGKTCENQKKRTDIRLSNSELKTESLVNKPHCLRFRIFGQNLAGIELRKVRPLIDKPFYVGFAVLELAKLHMYRFHYDYIQRKFGIGAAKLCFTDTDSLLYELSPTNPTDQSFDPYKVFFADHDEWFDNADYSADSPFFSVSNK
jgi:hypothetical protein